MKQHIVQVLGIALLAGLAACGSGQEKEKTSNDSTITDTSKQEAAPQEPEKPKEGRLTLLDVADADFKCDVTESKITKLLIDGQEKDPASMNKVFAQYWGTSQTIVITNFDLDKEKYFAFNADVKKFEPAHIRIEIGFNRFKKAENGSKSIAPELGEYANMREGFGLSAAVYSKDKAALLVGKVFLKAISSTKICASFELKTEDGKHEIVGQVISDNYVKP